MGIEPGNALPIRILTFFIDYYLNYENIDGSDEDISFKIKQEPTSLFIISQNKINKDKKSFYNSTRTKKITPSIDFKEWEDLFLILLASKWSFHCNPNPFCTSRDNTASWEMKSCLYDRTNRKNVHIPLLC